MSIFENSVENYSSSVVNPDPINRPRPVKKLAVVKYRKSAYDGMICVIDLENFLSASDVLAKYGRGVEMAYYDPGDDSAPVMYLKDQGAFKAVVRKLTGDSILEVGRWYTPEGFSQRIAYMKTCGARLGKAIKEERDRKIAEEMIKKMLEPEMELKSVTI